jgi:hypothetical protein
MANGKKTTSPAAAGGGSAAGGAVTACDDAAKSCKLVSITVVQNATQHNVTGAKNWAAVKKATDDVIVEATTTPNNDSCWACINWSGDAGKPVAGKANQRSFSRSVSKKIHVAAELGGGKDDLDIWVLWAKVKINTNNQTPPNAVQYGGRYDGTENLGTQTYDGGNSAVGKVVPEATITPAGVHDVVKSDWAFRRERISHDWNDGVKVTVPDYWNATWTDDTSDASFQKLIPDADDKIYDRDAPSIIDAGGNDYETYNNFREWIEWSGMTTNEGCSDKAEWYWKGVWQKAAAPQVTTKEVGTGNIVLPANSALHPPHH